MQSLKTKHKYNPKVNRKSPTDKHKKNNHQNHRKTKKEDKDKDMLDSKELLNGNLKMEDLNQHNEPELYKIKRLCTDGDEFVNNLKQSNSRANQPNLNSKKKNAIKSQPKQRPSSKNSHNTQNKTYYQTGVLYCNSAINNSKSNSNQQQYQISSQGIANSNFYQKVYSQKLKQTNGYKNNDLAHSTKNNHNNNKNASNLNNHDTNKDESESKLKILLQMVDCFLNEQKTKISDSTNNEPLSNYFHELFKGFEQLKDQNQGCQDFDDICSKIKEIFEMPLEMIFDKMYQLQNLVDQQNKQIQFLQNREKKQMTKLQKQYQQLQQKYQENLEKEQRMIKLLNLIKQQGIDIEEIYQEYIGTSLNSSFDQDSQIFDH